MKKVVRKTNDWGREVGDMREGVKGRGWGGGGSLRDSDFRVLPIFLGSKDAEMREEEFLHRPFHPVRVTELLY